jgi:hypothetical protein
VSDTGDCQVSAGAWDFLFLFGCFFIYLSFRGRHGEQEIGEPL